MVIPGKVSSEEKIARIIISPFHYKRSKNKFKPEAFMPKPREINEISVNRFDYTTADKCKVQGLKIVKDCTVDGARFVGLAIAQKELIEDCSTDEYTVLVFASPLDENGAQIEGRDVNIDDLGNPAHATIQYLGYDQELERNKVSSQRFKQLVAKPIVQLFDSNMFKDDNLNDENWVGEEIIID